MKEPLKFGIILFAFCAISAGILALVNSFTAPVIAEAEYKATMESYQAIFGEAADNFEEYDEAKLNKLKEAYPTINEVFLAKKGDDLVGYGIKYTAKGFGGSMTNAIGIRIADDKIAGFRNIVNQETKNFGSVIVEEDYYSSFPEKSATGELNISKEPAGENEIKWISGATVTSKGVLQGTDVVIEAYNNMLKEGK
ncbi:FMN-binding protein [Peptoniphilus catoniae]|uniref:FMN-binding protein n=1 Tax=Peptoniphilus catoniae TaxID=1660341 RepID=UPI0010FD480A|nr:FMN-binding protein [Peptoniphilus catoniae]